MAIKFSEVEKIIDESTKDLISCGVEILNPSKTDAYRKEKIRMMAEKYPDYINYLEECVAKFHPEYLQFVKTLKLLK